MEQRVNKIFLDTDFVEAINGLVENKMSKLVNMRIIKNKNRKLSELTEQLEETLSKEQKELFNECIRIESVVDKYYVVLAFCIGQKYSRSIENM